MQIRNILAATLLFSMTMAAVPALAATEVAAKQTTTLTLTGSTHSLPFGKSGTLDVKVTPTTASGDVIVYYKNLKTGVKKTYGVIPFKNGHGSAPRKADEVGTFNVYVVYNGSSKLKPSTSNNWKVTVTK
jgi:hypothetical protein